MNVLNLSGYKFITLTELPALKDTIHQNCVALGIKGTVLLGEEGININLSGTEDALTALLNILTTGAIKSVK